MSILPSSRAQMMNVDRTASEVHGTSPKSMVCLQVNLLLSAASQTATIPDSSAVTRLQIRSSDQAPRRHWYDEEMQVMGAEWDSSAADALNLSSASTARTYTVPELEPTTTCTDPSAAMLLETPRKKDPQVSAAALPAGADHTNSNWVPLVFQICEGQQQSSWLLWLAHKQTSAGRRTFRQVSQAMARNALPWWWNIFTVDTSSTSCISTCKSPPQRVGYGHGGLAVGLASAPYLLAVVLGRRTVGRLGVDDHGLQVRWVTHISQVRQ
jgi:hypothetical protein